MQKKQHKDTSLAKIFVGLLIIAGLVSGAVYLKDHFSLDALSRKASGASLENMQRARELYNQGNLAEARILLEPLAKDRDPVATPQAVLLLAQLNIAEGKKAEANALLENAYNAYADSPEFPKIAVAYARSLEEAAKTEEAAKVYGEVRDSAPPELRAPALVGLGRKAEQANDLLGARELYRKALEDAAWDSPEWNEALDALGQVNIAIIFSPAKTPESKVYTVQRGDSITSIGNNLNTTQGLLMRANNITEATVLNLNQQLKYTPKDFRIVIERSKCRLFLLDKDGIFKRYKVGLGKPGNDTALGSFKIGNKQKDPIWHKPGEGPIPALDPRNELGTRWMPLVPDQQGLPPDLGIHGTIRPETVGLYSSNGCARLLPAEIEELYDLVVRATPVDIVETYTGKAPALEIPATTPAITPGMPVPADAPAPATAIPVTPVATDPTTTQDSPALNN